jgi:low affinity Fe/Cu permease
MVFLIQNSQNRDSAAIQVKLDELIRVSKANNSFMGLEHLTDEELEEVQGKCQKHAQASKRIQKLKSKELAHIQAQLLASKDFSERARTLFRFV